MFVTNWISTTKIQKISEITNFFRHYFLSRTEVFSTHECNLLNLDLIRADEVWFVEKGKDGASHLTSLAEFKPRKDVRKGYLLGRYGAIPLLPKEEMKW